MSSACSRVTSTQPELSPSAGADSVTRTGPATSAAPSWMWAAVAVAMLVTVSS
jgi:hypothetical protein